MKIACVFLKLKWYKECKMKLEALPHPKPSPSHSSEMGTSNGFLYILLEKKFHLCVYVCKSFFTLLGLCYANFLFFPFKKEIILIAKYL
jgi:hypothetical protein